jgi:hypothetical protein
VTFLLRARHAHASQTLLMSADNDSSVNGAKRPFCFVFILLYYCVFKWFRCTDSPFWRMNVFCGHFLVVLGSLSDFFLMVSGKFLDRLVGLPFVLI